MKGWRSRLVRCRFEKDNWGIYSVQIEDHAGDEKVCAGVSALSMTLIGMLKNQGVEFNRLYYGSGNVDIDIRPFAEDIRREKTDLIFTTIYFGLKQLEHSYPDKITVTENTPII